MPSGRIAQNQIIGEEKKDEEIEEGMEKKERPPVRENNKMHEIIVKQSRNGKKKDGSTSRTRIRVKGR